MTSKERILRAINGEAGDRVPMTTWCFGFKPPEHLQWISGGKQVGYWYTKRLEHIHSLPFPWTLEDDFKRVRAWFSMGVDDVLDVSVPWSISPEVTVKDRILQPGENGGDRNYPTMFREYRTPGGTVTHAVKRTGKEPEGWPVQPEVTELIEDFNVPRAVKHPVTMPGDIEGVRYLFGKPDQSQKTWFRDRMARVKEFADQHGVLVQAWTAFGIDAAIWLCGIENATTMSMLDPVSFGRLVDHIAETDRARTELALAHPGVDMVCQRGWYSSTDFWSPELADTFLFPHVRELADLAHKHGKKFAYVMTTGVELLGSRLADAGVDVLYFVDPVLDKLSCKRAAELFGDRMTMVGGINSNALVENNPLKIRDEVREAMDVLGPTNRFILHPVDSLFPDVPWESVACMIDAWKEYQ